MKVEDVERKVQKLMETETHQEAFFRAMLAMTELGDAVKYITHDQKLNPLARPHGTAEDEVLAHGQLLIQAISIAVARNISVVEALEAGLKNWEDRDWKKKEAANTDLVTGKVAVPGNVEGQAYVVSKQHTLNNFQFGILVLEFLRPNQVEVLFNKSILGLITDNGGVCSHPAMIAREFNIVAVVGTGDATKRIPHGANIRIEAEGEEGNVIVLKVT